MFRTKKVIDKIYMGCGDDYKDGYVGCDIRKTKTAKIICKAWELSKHCKNVSEIYSRHMVEHLTYAEFDATLKDWYKTLKVGGKLHIICPDLDFHIEQFKNAIFDEENFNNKWSNFSHGVAGLYGWQRECDIDNKDTKTKYWDVHKSGYNKKIMYFYLNRNRFVDIDIKVVDKWHLVAVGYKNV